MNRAISIRSVKANREWVRFVCYVAVVFLALPALSIVGGPDGAVAADDHSEATTDISDSSTRENGTVYTGGDGIYAIDAATGSELWSYTENTGWIRSSPTVVDGIVYAGSELGEELHAVDADSGEEVWTFDEPTGAVSASPTVVDGTVYFGANDNTLYAVDAYSGEKEWTFEGGTGTATVENGIVYVSSGSVLYAVDANSGEEVWRYEEHSGGMHPPTVSDGVVYAGTSDGVVYAVDADSGEEAWTFDGPSRSSEAVNSKPTVFDGVVYVDTLSYEGGATVYAVDSDTGEERWSFNDAQADSTSSAIVYNDTVYFGSREGLIGGQLHALDVDSGEELWSFDHYSMQTVKSTPTAYDGVLYIGPPNGALQAVDEDSGETLWTFDDQLAKGRTSPTIVPEGSDRSEGARVMLGVKGHHDHGGGDRTITTSGRVTFENGAPIEDATVTFVHPETNVELTTVRTNHNGVWRTTYFGSRADADVEIEAFGGTEHVESVEIEPGEDYEFSVSLDTTTISGTVRTGNGTPIGDASIAVNGNESEPIAEISTDADGYWETRLPSKSHDSAAVTASYRNESARRHVEIGEERISDVNFELEICGSSVDGLIYTPRDPTTSDRVTFQSPCLETETLVWNVDQQTHYGSQFTTRFTDPGTYTVSLTADGETYTDHVEVTEPPIEIVGVEPQYEAPMIDGVNIENRYDIVVSGTESADSVVLEHRDTRYDATEDRDLGPETTQYSVAVESDALELSQGPNEIVVTASSESGHSDSTTVILEQTVPANSLSFTDIDYETGVVYLEQDYWNYGGQSGDLFDPLIPDGVPIGTNVEYGGGSQYSVSGRYDLTDGTLDYEETAVTGINVLGRGAELRAENTMRDSDDPYVLQPRLRDMRVAGGISVGIGPNFKLDIGGTSVELTTSVDPMLSSELRGLQYDDRRDMPTGVRDSHQDAFADVNANTPVELRSAKVSPFIGLELQFYSAIDHDVFPYHLHGEPEGFKAEFDGGVTVSGPGLDDYVDAELFGFDPSTLLSSPSVTLQISELLDVFGIDPAIEIGETRNPPDSKYISVSTATNSPDTRVRDLSAAHTTVAGSNVETPLKGSTKPSSASVDFRSDPLDRITHGSVRDSSPAIAGIDSGEVIVWSTDRTNSSAALGRDIAYSTREEGTWSEPSYLTPADNRSHSSPSIATNGDEAMAAWRVIDADLAGDENESLDSNSQIAIAHFDGDEWSDPTVLTDTDDATELPDVAPIGDDWVITWDQSPEMTLTREGAGVRYRVVDDDGTALATERVDSGVGPAVTGDGDTATVLYYAYDSHELIQNRIGSAGDGFDREPIATAKTSDVEYFATGTDAFVWTESDDTTIRFATVDTTDEMEIDDEFDAVHDLELFETDLGPIVVYRAIDHENGTNELVYRLRRNGEWITDRALTTAENDELQLWQATTTEADDGFVSVFAAHEPGPNSVTDLFSVDHEFTPDYELDATIRDDYVSPGEEATIEIALANVGDLHGTETVPVEIRVDGTEVGTETFEPIDPGENATREITVEIDGTGTVDLAVDPTIEQFTRDNAVTTVTAATPELTITNSETTRPSADETIVNVTVKNTGPVDSTDVTVRLDNGTRSSTVGVTTIDELPATDEQTVSIPIDPDEVDTETIDRISIEVDDATVDGDVKRTWFLQPDLTVYGPVTYRNDGRDELVADLVVSNAGTLSTNATVRAFTRDANGKPVELGATDVDIDATTTATSRSVSVTVPLGEVERGTPLWFTADTDVPLSHPTSATLFDEVRPGPDDDASLTVTVTDAVDETPIANGVVWVDDLGVETDAGGTATVRVPTGPATVRIDGDGYEPYEKSFAVDGDDDRAIELMPDGPTGTATGTVTGVSEVPIENATVTVAETGIETTTDADGSFQFELPIDEYTLAIDADGHEPTTETVVVAANATTTVAVTLEERDNDNADERSETDNPDGEDDGLPAFVPITTLLAIAISLGLLGRRTRGDAVES